jgi:hypothetical protein
LKTNKKFKTDSKDSLKILTFASICFFLVESRGHVFFCNREIKKKKFKNRKRKRKPNLRSQYHREREIEREACMKGYNGCGLA